MGQTITSTAVPPRRTGPIVLVVAGVALFGLGIWMFASGLWGTVDTVRDSLAPATDVTSGLTVVAAVPGEASARLEPDRYQVVAIGGALTDTRLNAPGVNEREVYALPFTRPDVAVTGPAGAVTLVSPSIDQLVDGPAGDLVAIGEFTVETGATYTIAASGSETSVTRVGIDVRPDIGDTIRDSVVDMGKLVLGGFVGFFGFALVLGGILWRVVRQRVTGLAVVSGSA